MRARLLRHWPALPLVAALAWTVGQSRLEGDGTEYLMVARAFSRHASPEVRPDDVQSLLGLPRAAFADIPAGRPSILVVARAMARGEEGPVCGLVRTPDGEYYSMHFWLYPLLLTPFVLAADAAGASPSIAFGLLNLAFALVALGYLLRATGPGPRFHAAAWLFFLGGTSCNVPLAGPEVMIASGVLLACVAAMRGSFGAAVLAAGAAASQNPSALFLLPAIGLAFLLLRARPALAWGGRPVGLRLRRDAPLAAAGAAIALLPFLFFERKFGVPSVIAALSTDAGLMGGERLFSLFFDLNQGMIVGAPGLLAVAIAAPAVAVARGPGRWGPAVAASLVAATVLAMALPTLVPHNWNAGTRSAIRYAYWLSMPLLALALYLLPALGRRAAIAVAAAGLALQLLPVGLFGLAGTDDAHLAHNALAARVLARAPSAYAPIPEIFVERTLGVEGAVAPGRAVVYLGGGRATKVLRPWTEPGLSAGLCPRGQELDAAGSRVLDGGWQYVDGPFRCAEPGESSRLGTWRFGRGSPEARALLGEGWSGAEPEGTWTDGAVARLRVPIRAGARPWRLLWKGHYYRGNEGSLVRVNGHDLGRLPLADAEIVIPEEARGAAVLEIELGHPSASSPLSHGESADGRMLGLFLNALALDAEP